VVQVGEASFLQVLGHPAIARNLEGAARPLAGCPKEVAPGLEDVVGVVVDAGVLGPRLEIDFDALKPAAGFESGESLLVELLPVVNAAKEIAGVDEVECVVLERPIQLCVVDLERTVCGQPAGLDGRDVGPDHLCLGELVGHVATRSVSAQIVQAVKGGHDLHGPDASAGAHIEDLLWVFDRGRIQLVVHEHEGILVSDIVALDVLVVGRGPVLSGLGRLIGAPMDGAVFVNARRYGRSRLAEAS